MGAVDTFIDTNILLYSIDDRDVRKRDIARSLISELCSSGNGHISVQVVNEFASNLLRQFGRTPVEVNSLCESLVDLRLEVANLNQVREALRIMTTASISFWDASIVSSAAISGCKVLVSEDLSANAVIAGVRIVNPFP